MPKKKPKVFSLEEAEALLPELERRLRRLQVQKETYSRRHDLLFMHELVCAAERSNGLFEEQDDLEVGIHALEAAIEDLAKDVDAIFARGCFLRNIEQGRIEFFGILEGREVFFSWQLGEPFVGYYRPRGKKAHERLSLPHRSARKAPQ